MKFEPVSSQVPGVRVWGAKAHGRSFTITHTPRIGFSASWKGCASIAPQASTFLPGSPFLSLNQAVAACRLLSRRFAR